MKKTTRLILATCLALGTLFAQAQTYVFNSPEGYASGVTGGGNGPITVVTTMAEFKTALTATGAARIIVKGAVQVDYLSVQVNDKTILGLPGSKLFTNVKAAGLSGILYIKPGSSNVIFRNVTFEGPGAWDTDGRDCMTLDGATKIWIDHCDFQDGMDGNLDSKGDADDITISWCRFRYLKPATSCPSSGAVPGCTDDHRFTNLVGSGSTDKPADKLFSITWQYCWWDEGCVERMTRARNAELHFLNCYWNTSVGKVLLGLEAANTYVENSVFAGAGTKYKSYGGTINLTCVGSVSAPANVGTCPPPSYNNEAINSSLVVSAVSGNCGSGATLTVTEAGAISASCGGAVLSPILETTSAENQTITTGNAISPIVYTWGGSATGVTVTGLPAGLTGVTNATAKTYTISGTPSASGSYSISTTQSSGSASLSSGKISLLLAVPGNFTTSYSSNNLTINWSKVTGATGYVVNFCSPSSGTVAPKKQWDFTAAWTTNASSADANLVIDAGNANRFNYVPATTNTELKFASGTAIPEVAGLLFTQAGATKVRLGFGTSLLYLNGASITISIPCAVGDKITVVGPAGNATAVDRGYSATGGTLSTTESVNVDANGIMNVAGAIGTWVYTATSSSIKITSVTGGMNIQKITIGGSGGAACTEYTVTGSATSYTIPNLVSNTNYTYQVKATNGIVAEVSAYSAMQDIAGPLGFEEASFGNAQTSLFPNPTTNVFQIAGIDGLSTVSVSDLSGRILLTKEVSANETIETDVLVQGIYMVKIASSKGTFLRKLVKK